jgi:hypothetical protein
MIYSACIANDDTSSTDSDVDGYVIIRKVSDSITN